MDHIVYLDKKSNELEHILSGKQDIILRGATGRKLPYGRANTNDILYLCNNNGENKIKASCRIKQVTYTDKLTQEESEQLVDSYLNRIDLHPKTLSRFRGKRYLSIIEIDSIVELTPFSFNKEAFSNMDDWLLVEDIKRVLL